MATSPASKNAPKSYGESDRVGTLEIFPEFSDGLDGIEAGQTLVALFWLHKASRDVLKIYPRGDRSRGLRGVFAARSPGAAQPDCDFRTQGAGRSAIGSRCRSWTSSTAPIIDLKKIQNRRQEV